MLGLPENITYVSLAHFWWKNPPEWRAFASKVDDNRERVKGFQAIADNETAALERVLEEARLYVFAPITSTVPDLGLELDLML